MSFSGNRLVSFVIRPARNISVAVNFISTVMNIILQLLKYVENRGIVKKTKT